MKSLLKVLALAAVLGVSGMAMAEAAAPGAAEPAAKPKPDKPVFAGVRGAFVKLDGATLVVKGRDGEKQLKTDDATKVEIEGKEAKLADLKEGQRLQITTDPADATKAVKVTVMPAGGGRGPKKPAPAGGQ